MSAAVGLLAGVAAGYAQAKRQKTLDEREKDYMDTMKEYRRAQIDKMRGTPDSVTVPTQAIDFGSENAYARGGLVGAGQGECMSKPCDFYNGSSNDGGWQKANYKK